MRLTVDERQERILRLVRERGSLRVAELAVALGVSAVTTRRDVEALAELGRLRRVHGSVAWPEEEAPVTAPQPRVVLPSGVVLGLLVPAASYYYAEVIRGAQSAAAAAGARLILGISDYRPEEDAAQISALLGAGVDGLLITPSWAGSAPSAEEEQTVLGLGLPTVLLERRAVPGSGTAELDRVCTDHVHGACVAVRHLADLGRRRIALLARPGTPTTEFVEAGYHAGLDWAGLSAPVPSSTLSSHDDFEERLREIPKAVAAGAVDGVLVHTDTDAIMLLQQLQARGVRVPEDVSLVAYDDEMAALADVPLTAIAPPKHALGAAAVTMLLDRLAPGPTGQSPHRHLDLLPQLHVRASSGTATGSTA